MNALTISDVANLCPIRLLVLPEKTNLSYKDAEMPNK